MKTLGCTLLIALFAMTAMAADVTGKWKGSFAPEGQDPSSAFVVLKQSGTTLTGTAGPGEDQQWPLANGKVVGNKITGEVTSPEGLVFKLDLVLEGEHIKGDVNGMRDGQAMKAKIDLTRVKS
jgi:hypothetical protein